jgi:ATP:ADP antiporter, AAA family
VTDTLGYRIGDQLGAWSYGGLHAVGLELQSISFVAVPVVAGWCGLSLWLARKQRVLAEAQRKEEAAVAQATPEAA